MGILSGVYRKVLTTALNTFAEQTGITPFFSNSASGAASSVVSLYGGKYHWFCGIFPGAYQKGLGLLVSKLNSLPPGAHLLITDYVNPTFAHSLKKAGVQFIDASGNCHLSQGDLLIYIRGNPQQVAFKSKAQMRNQAFSFSGLQVIFSLLAEPRLLNLPFRQIAISAGVSLGTVSRVFKGLGESGFLARHRLKNKRVLKNREQIFEYWVEGYNTRLRNRLYLGTFVPQSREWFNSAIIQQYAVLFGGELAAAVLTRYLQFQENTLYLDQIDLMSFLKDFRFRRATDLDYDNSDLVHIYSPFWPQGEGYAEFYPPESHDLVFVHPIITYADLLASNDPRNIETAEVLFDQFIAPALQASTR